MYPVYLDAYQNGKLNQVIEKSSKLLESCTICPRLCKINRLENKKGFCKTGLRAKVYSFMLHHGEEPPISGDKGSGTIFFSNCNMHCNYCQNYEFSQLGEGREVEDEELADFMLRLQNLKAHNINLVTPTHIMPQILKALGLAIKKGLKIPLIYNTSGYESAEIIKLLEGVVDIYMPDMRYAESSSSEEYSSARDYPCYNQDAILEMHRQVGIAKMDNNGIIKRGLIVRHLVLPNGISGTEKIMKFISQRISPETYISLMSQYLPCYKAKGAEKLSRRISYEEYRQAQDITEKYGLHNGWTQESRGLERFAGIHIKPSL